MQFFLGGISKFSAVCSIQTAIFGLLCHTSNGMVVRQKLMSSQSSLIKWQVMLRYVTVWQHSSRCQLSGQSCSLILPRTTSYFMSMSFVKWGDQQHRGTTRDHPLPLHPLHHRPQPLHRDLHLQRFSEDSAVVGCFVIIHKILTKRPKNCENLNFSKQ